MHVYASSLGHRRFRPTSRYFACHGPRIVSRVSAGWAARLDDHAERTLLGVTVHGIQKFQRSTRVKLPSMCSGTAYYWHSTLGPGVGMTPVPYFSGEPNAPTPSCQLRTRTGTSRPLRRATHAAPLASLASGEQTLHANGYTDTTTQEQYRGSEEERGHRMGGWEG